MEIENGPFVVSGFSIGHWTDPLGSTGCTVLLADRQAPAAVDVRGGSPGTRETNLLDPSCMVQGVDAILLTGGSAFGLAASEGVMRWLRENGRGYLTPAIPVPIVSGAVIFDLVGDEPTWPDVDAGYAAAVAAGQPWQSGRLGAGTGATVSKGAGRENAVPSGIGVARITVPAGSLSALFVVNAVGDIVDDQNGTFLTTPAGQETSTEQALLGGGSSVEPGQNTVIGAVVCDRPMDNYALARMTISAHAGLARAIRPAHSPADGDTIFALAPSRESVSSGDLIQLSTACQVVCARAITNSVRPAPTPSG